MKSFSQVTLTIAYVALLGAVANGVFPVLTHAETTCTAEGILFDENNKPIDVCDPSAVTKPVEFKRSGLFGCSQTAAYRMSVGALSAVGGVYVPVNDAAVTLNTGYLVYKECILDGASKRIAESASTGLVNKGLTDILTGREGGRPLWPENLSADIKERQDQSHLYTLQSGELSTLHPALRSDVIRADARNYVTPANQALTCPYGDLEGVFGGHPDDIWGGLMTFTNPACNPLGALVLTESYTRERDSARVGEMLFRLLTNQGLYDVEEYDPTTGSYITRTPGAIVAGNLQQLITSGFRQLENADEIDQMVGALFSGLSTQVISDSRGLAGLTRSVAGQPSYLEQMTREAAQGLRDAAVNIAIQILGAAKQVETTYLNAMNAIATNLTQAIGQLRTAENSCWDLIIPKAREYASQHSFQIQVATSTTFSKQVIDSQIAPLATITLTNVAKSEQALSLIDKLIAGVTNTTSLEAQRLALQQLDALVAQGTLHNQYDAGQATQRKDEVEEAMTTLVEDTIKAWADSTDLNVGWCNINNPDVAKMWAEKWRK